MSNQKVAINGAKWTSIATVITTLLSFSTLAIIARVLEPSVFGLVSICSLVLNFFHIFANLGFTNSIIAKQEKDVKVLSTIFYASIGLGVIIGLIIYASSPLVVAFYHEPRLNKLIKLSAFTFPMIYTSQIYWNLLQKELQFRKLALVDIITEIFDTIITIWLAYHGFEELSIIYSQLLFTVVKTILYIYLGRDLFKPVWYLKLVEIKDHLRFGIYHLGEGILGFASSNLETLVIGKAIGVTELGLYNIAYQLAVFPIYKLNPIIMQVSYPIMAKMKEDSGLRRAYLKIVDFITYCNFPLLAGLFITSGSVVILIYGPRYAASAELIKIILGVSVLACVIAPASSLAMSKSKPNVMFYLTLGMLFFQIPIVYVSSKYFGLLGIAYGTVLTGIIQATLTFIIVKNLVGSIFVDFLKNVIKPVAFCLIMVFAIFLYQKFVGQMGLVNTIIQVVIGVIIYGALTLKYKLSFKEILELKKSL